MPLKVIIPLIILVVVFVGFCFQDIWRSERTNHLPKWVWSIICVISIPLGGILYFIFGKSKVDVVDKIDD